MSRMRTFLGLAVAAALLALPAAPASADPVDDAVATVHYVLCPFPEVDGCLTYPMLDSVLCPVLSSSATGVPGVVEIEWDGDAYVAGHLVWGLHPVGLSG
jgi:hypothetical protein